MGILNKLFGKNDNKVNKSQSENNIYSQSINIFFDYFDTPNEIQSRIIALAGDDDRGSLIYLFAPYYFCKLLFPEIIWTDYYLEQDWDGNQTKKYFAQSDLLKELEAHILNNFTEYKKRDLNKILVHSADIKAINQMMHNGSKLENLNAMPPVVMGKTSNANIDDIYNNEIVLKLLKEKLEKLGHQVEKHPDYFSLLLNNDLEIAFNTIKNPNAHPSILEVLVLTMHKEYFPFGIEEYLVGMGANIQDKAYLIVESYINMIFAPILSALKSSEETNVKVIDPEMGIELCPYIGDLMLRGKWELNPEKDFLYKIIVKDVLFKLSKSKFNWLSIYLAKNRDTNQIYCECRLNNEPWNGPIEALEEYAKSWEMIGDFKSMKQFIIFRRGAIE